MTKALVIQLWRNIAYWAATTGTAAVLGAFEAARLRWWTLFALLVIAFVGALWGVAIAVVAIKELRR
jgi:hypothetical protein